MSDIGPGKPYSKRPLGLTGPASAFGGRLGTAKAPGEGRARAVRVVGDLAAGVCGGFVLSESFEFERSEYMVAVKAAPPPAPRAANRARVDLDILVAARADEGEAGIYTRQINGAGRK